MVERNEAETSHAKTMGISALALFYAYFTSTAKYKN